MTSVSYPGVYVEEIPGGARPIETASTSTAAFVGVTERGPDGSEFGELGISKDPRATRITSWQQFQDVYGGFIPDSKLAESIYQFFNNGGRQCYIIRVVGTDSEEQTTASVTLENRADSPTNGVIFYANSTGAWGNDLYLNIEDGEIDPGNTFTVSVYKQVNPTEEITSASTPLEVHDNLSMDENSDDYFVDRLQNDSNYIVAQLHPNNIDIILGYHLGGIVSVDAKAIIGSQFQINLDGDGFQEVMITIDSTNETLATLAQKIQEGVQALTKRSNATPAETFSQFKCELTSDNRLKLISGNKDANSSVLVRAGTDNDVTAELKLGEAAGGVSFGGLSNRRPAAIPDGQPLYQLGHSLSSPPTQTELDALPERVTDGTEGKDVNFAGLPLTAYSDAFQYLDNITDVSLLAVPGVPGMFDAGVTYCENRPLRDIFFIGETFEIDDEPAEAEAYRKGIIKPNSYGAVYFPWIKSPDLSGQSTTPVLLPPSGFIAGLYARIDNTRGVWKAPAGTEASISGATGLAIDLSDIEQGNLNKISVNCLRRFDLAGIVSWGARTVHTDPEYKYVPVRRTAIMLRRSIYDGIQWAVFEPNDHRLWASLRTNIGAFMNGLFRAGAFQGEKASDAYFVRCGLGDTMEQSDIDRGQVIVSVGFAPLKPAEFVIVRIQQKAGQNQ